MRSGKTPDSLLLFRVGDFYETFDEDAKRSAQVLGITLTKRSNGAASDTALAGFPFHALDTYLPKLIRSGLKVAICEQLESLSGKSWSDGVLPNWSLRGTPQESILDDDQNNYLAAFAGDERKAVLAFLDFSTGEFLLIEGTQDQLALQLSARQPREVLLDRSNKAYFQKAFGNQWLESYLPDWVCRSAQGEKELKAHFGVENLKGFGLEKKSESMAAAGMLIHYLRANGHDRLDHVSPPSYWDPRNSCGWTISLYEIWRCLRVPIRMPFRFGKLWIRLQRPWETKHSSLAGAPLRLPDQIRERHDRVSRIGAALWNARLGEILRPCIDLERAIARLFPRRFIPVSFISLRARFQHLKRIF